MSNDIILVNSITKRNKISIKKQGTKLLGLSEHHDWAGNPCEEGIQKQHIIKSITY